MLDLYLATVIKDGDNLGSNTSNNLNAHKMFPFKTDSQKKHTNRSVLELGAYLNQKIAKKQLMQITYDNTFYGEVGQQKACFELGQTPIRNAFRPAVVLQWKDDENGAEIEWYFKLEQRITILFSILPLMGLYLSFQNNLILPFVFATFLTLVMFGLVYWVYSKSKQSTKQHLTQLLNEFDSTLP